MPSTQWLPKLAVPVFFVALTLVFTYPIGTSPGTYALDLGPDTRLFLWTLAWDAHALTSDPLSIFDANIFFPEPRTLAYSEHQIGSALFATPVILASGNLVLGLNVALLASCALSGLGTYYLARTIGLSRWGALVAGVVFALTPPRFFRLGQLHLATVQWIPVTLALLHRYAGGGSRRHLLGAVVVFTLQALSGGQSGLFLALASAALLASLAVVGELAPRSRLATDGLLAAGLALALNLPFVLPYLQVQQELGLERSLSEAAFWSPNAESFVASPAHAHRLLLRGLGWERGVLRDAKAYLFPGILPIVLALAALVATGRGAPSTSGASSRRPPAPRGLRALDVAITLTAAAALLIQASGGIDVRLGPVSLSASDGDRAAVVALVLALARLAVFRRAPFALLPWAGRLRDRYRVWVAPRLGVAGGFYLLLALVTLWASLGPSAGLYAALYRLLPGFDFIRVPSRLTLLTVLGLAVLAGIGADKLARRSRSLVVAAVSLLLVEMAAFPLDAREYTVAIPAMDRFLRDEAASGPVAVFPVPDPRDALAAARRHSAYMLYSTMHFLPLVNGYSGFTPPGHDRLFRRLAGFPAEDALDALEEVGVRYAVLHRDGYADDDWREMLERLDGDERLALLAEVDEGRVYEVSITRRDPRGRGW